MVAIGALMRKLIHWCFGVLKIRKIFDIDYVNHQMEHANVNDGDIRFSPLSFHRADMPKSVMLFRCLMGEKVLRMLYTDFRYVPKADLAYCEK